VVLDFAITKRSCQAAAIFPSVMYMVCSILLVALFFEIAAK
jgi:hypothetical protein